MRNGRTIRGEWVDGNIITSSQNRIDESIQIIEH